MSPEIVNKKPYRGQPTDIWASGVLCYAMLCGCFPFRGLSDKQLYKKIATAEMTFPEHVSLPAQQFITEMIVQSPSQRATALSLLLNTWLTPELTKTGS